MWVFTVSSYRHRRRYCCTRYVTLVLHIDLFLTSDKTTVFMELHLRCCFSKIFVSPHNDLFHQTWHLCSTFGDLKSISMLTLESLEKIVKVTFPHFDCDLTVFTLLVYYCTGVDLIQFRYVYIDISPFLWLQCFGSDGKLVIYYCRTQAWGWCSCENFLHPLTMSDAHHLLVGSVFGLFLSLGLTLCLLTLTAWGW